MNGISVRSLLILAIGATMAIAANMLTLVMIGQINRKLPESEQISYIFWGIGKVLRYHRQYYPRSWLPYLSLACGALMIASCAILAWSLGLLRWGR
ncbi:MAG: hypothetical protein LAP39_18445 [Acidobacteriia bacterium]|nr:hypothetical protein [Terriglobia bacterium]